MRFVTDHSDHSVEIIHLFAEVFTASEGAAEGNLIKEFVTDLMATPQPDLHVFSAWQDNMLAGCICLSRLTYALDHRQVFILSPVAVRTDQQKSGIGQRLITYGLNALWEHGVDFVVTYGDPAYYSKTGFQPITEDFAAPPLPLSHPHGWMGQFLTTGDTAPLKGESRCVAALNRPALW